jgi:endoglucanase
MALLPTSDVVAELGRGINLAGVFDRRDDRPGWPVRAEHVAAIASAGFTALRVPVRWWGRADELLASVEALVEIAWSHGLAVELLNEPRPPMTPSDWNALLPRVLAGVREHDSKRVVIAGGAEAATLAGLRQLQLPRDEHLIATLHYYEPFRFTHQGAAWEAGAHDWLGTSWGTLAEHAAVTTDLETPAAWARREGVRLYVGEFGTIDTADHDSRVRWTHWVRRELDRLDLPWAYWDFATDFGAYDRHRHGWRPELLEALVR